MAIQGIKTNSESNNPIFPQKEGKLINEHMLQEFSNHLKRCFPTFVASVITLNNGLPVFLESKEKFDENLLALTAICQDRQLLDLSNYHKIIRPLSKNVRLLVILNKSRTNYSNYGEFENILAQKNPI